MKYGHIVCPYCNCPAFVEPAVHDTAAGFVVVHNMPGEIITNLTSQYGHEVVRVRVGGSRCPGSGAPVHEVK